MNVDIAAVCADHLHHEEALLAETLPALRALKAAFVERRFDHLATLSTRQQEWAQRVDALKTGRSRLRAQLAAALGLASTQVTLKAVLMRLPADTREPLVALADRLRTLLDELVSINHWLAVHVQVYLGAWQGMLHGLTGTAASSGRYGPTGKTEVSELRPILKMHG